MTWLEPVTLEGTAARLEPLEMDHVPHLERAAADGELWRLWVTSVPAPAGTRRYVEEALDAQIRGTALPFVVRRRADGEIVGSTRFCHAEPQHRRVEIGYTWYAKSAQRSAINTDCKCLLLTHAFETLNAVAVEFRTHFHNRASRLAIERLGARQDGVLRQHQILPDGTLRDTVVYSILDREWPTVRRGLQFMLESHHGAEMQPPSPGPPAAGP